MYLEGSDTGVTTSPKSKFALELIKKKREYIDSFTVHGLTRVYSTSRFESFTWAFIVTGAVLLSTWLTYSIVDNYLEYNIYTEVTTPLEIENPFPSITLCDFTPMVRHYFSYCNRKRGEAYEDLTKPCNESILESTQRLNVHNRTDIWGNGLFDVKVCYTWGGKTCTTDKYLKSLERYDHSCITLNHAGNLHDAYAHIYMEFELNQTNSQSNPFIIALVHDPLVSEFDMTNRFVFEHTKTYELNIQKTVIKRLPPPFPSNCTSDDSLDIFPGKYTRRTCLESFTYLHTYRECGDILDYHKRYIPKNFLEKYKQNKSISEVLRCIMEQSQKVQDIHDCPFPCEEIEYMTRLFMYDNTPYQNKQTRYRFHVQYLNIDSYHLIEEKQLITWDQVAGKIGGLISLVLGASFISIIEIGFYLSLSLLYHGQKLRKCLPKRRSSRVGFKQRDNF